MLIQVTLRGRYVIIKTAIFTKLVNLQRKIVDAKDISDTDKHISKYIPIYSK